MANENRKNVYFSKQNQDLKEFVEEYEPDFTKYVMSLIRKDMENVEPIIETGPNLSIIEKQLEQMMKVILDINHQISNLKEQAIAPNPLNALLYQMSSFQQPPIINPTVPTSNPIKETTPEPKKEEKKEKLQPANTALTKQLLGGFAPKQQ